MNEPKHNPQLDGDDEKLVDLVTAVLVDPNLNTDRRMRLHEEISTAVSAAHEELHGPERRATRTTVTETDGGVQKMLESVLVDPDLTTATRMRLHHEIPKLIRTAREHAGASS